MKALNWIIVTLLLSGIVAAPSPPDPIYCDWANNFGNTLCTYSGHWWTGRTASGENPGQDFADLRGDNAIPLHEEDDAYTTVGLDARITTLGNISIAFSAGAMDWYGNLCASGTNCDITNLEIRCGGTSGITVYAQDPCNGRCNYTQKSATCSFSNINANYEVRAKASANTKDEAGNSHVEVAYAYHPLQINCVSNADCLSGQTCNIIANGGITRCEGTATCTITSVEWVPSGTVVEGTQVTMRAHGTGCAGTSLLFDVIEYDSDTSYTPVYNVEDTTFSNGVFEKTWTATWTDDGAGQNPPEYKFVATYGSSEMRSGLLTVTQALSCNNDGSCGQGETKTNCPADCNKSIGTGCTANNQCSTNFCDGNTGTCQAATSCTDGDQDGYGSPGSATCSAGSTLPDCDDTKPFVNPGAIEQCNSIDDNCNDQTDEGGVCTPQPTCNDQDQDGYGSPATGCLQSLPDCDDSKSNVHPNAPEICDGLDNDCDGPADEANVCCQNNQCDTGLGENPQTCGQDCYTSYQIMGIQSPNSVNQGQTVQVTASIKNTGTWPGTTNVEGGIIPDAWLPFSSSKCCSSNNFFGAQQTTIQPGQTNNIQFTLTAPGVTTKDGCGGQPAWDTSHEIIIGLYTNCGNVFQLKSNQDIKIQDKPCSKPSDCTIPIEKCIIPQGSTAGTCQANTCTNICTSGQYTCSGGTIRHCEDTNSDGCYEWKDTTVCPPGQTCVQGQSTCANVQIATEPFIEEATGGHVYKQINDSVILNLKYAQQEQISLYYQSTQFELDTATCQQTFTIDKDTACKFKVKTNLEGAQLGVQKQNTIKAARADILTTNNHNGIIITNKKKLKERFAGQEQSVQNLLSEAYGFADNDDLIIYDLQELPVMHPWANFPTYQETIANPFMVDNTLSIEIGKFIREKCIPPQCQSTLILGDDYVVPHYRRYAQFLNSYFFYSAINTQALYSEIPYVERTTKEFSQMDEVLSNDGYAKPVVIIRPDSVSTEMRIAINRLKSTLQLNFSSSPTERNSSSITCNDPQIFNNLNGVTVILIGTEQNNRAFNCMPFVAGLENRDSAFLEVNPWDGGEYSIVINTENSKVINTFSDALHTGAYKKILGRHWYFIEVAVTVASFASMACTPFGIPCDIITDAIDSQIQCGVKQDALMCGVSSAMLVIPYVPSAPIKLAVKAFVNYVGPPGAVFLTKYGPSAVMFIGKIIDKVDDFQVYLKKAANHFGAAWDDIASKIALFPEDEAAISFSIKKLEDSGKTLDEFYSQFGDMYRAKLLKLNSKYDELIKNRYQKHLESKLLFRGDDRYPTEIFYSKAGGFRAKNSAYTDLKTHIIENKPSIFIDTSELRNVASTSANSNNGWVYEIVPRAENRLDVSKSIPELADGYKQSKIVSYLDEIPTEEIPCAYKLDAAGKVIDILFNSEFEGSVPDGSLCKK